MLLVVFIALCTILITLDFRQSPGGPLERAKDLSTALVAPVQRGLTAVTRPVGGFFSSLGEIGSLRRRNVDLKGRVDSMRSKVQEAQALVDQNQQLRRQLGLRRSWQSMPTVAAEVFGNAPANYRWAVYIDRGSADGVRRDMAVLSADGLVGKVVRAATHSATVLLLMDPGAYAGAYIRAQDGGGRASAYTGVVNGTGDPQKLELSYVDPDANVSVGDDVVTRGVAGGVFPAGIPVGVVSSVVDDGGALDQRISVQPAVRFDTLQFVEVLIQPGAHVRVSARS
ncbi:rod shape-determining protein MreC [soil metagenome]